MRKLAWSWGVLLCGAVTLSSWACSDSASSSPSENGAGQANEAGAGGGGGDSSVGGAGAAPVDECHSDSIADYCSRGWCPEDPEDVDLDYCEENRLENALITQQRSNCGGVSIVRYSLFEGTTYHFDADGKLVGVQTWSESPYDCPTSFGRECELEGPVATLCGEVDRCRAEPLNDFCDNYHVAVCPAEEADIELEQLCGGRNTVQRFATECAGTLYRHDDGAHQTDLSFDAGGSLVGIVITAPTAGTCWFGNWSKVRVAGTPCEPEGAGEALCGGVGDRP